MKLFRVSIKNSMYHWIKPKPVYAVAESKEAAIEYVKRHLRAPNEVVSASYLGEQLGDRMFSPNKD
jgi:hypothetical protein